MPYIAREALVTAIERLKGTADHLLKIWFTLKQMGMTSDTPVYVTTSSPDEALNRLFSCGSPDGDFYIPFAHTLRFMTMKPDAGRSIVQTNLRRWATSGSVVTVDPTSYLQIREASDGSLEVKPHRSYPQGLGYGKDGFAFEADSRVMVPLMSFGVWYYRQEELPDEPDMVAAIKRLLREDLQLSPAETELVFVSDDPPWTPTFQNGPLSDQEVFSIVQDSLGRGATRREVVIHESSDLYISRVKSMTTVTTGPRWLNVDPMMQLRNLVEAGAKAVLLYGPPRTGKTRAVDQLFPREDPGRETIQIHDGWGYDELILSLRPGPDGQWDYQKGPLLTAIENRKSCIVLEEINRTEFTQAIGEVFSLIETAYRGEEHKIRLRNGDYFSISPDVVIICTMNTLDRSTEEIDDALFGRMDAVAFPPRVEDLYTMLLEKGVDEATVRKLQELFATIQQSYPMGHGFFAPFGLGTNPVTFYLTRIRPVLQKHLENYRDHELTAIDEKVEQLFG